MTNSNTEMLCVFFIIVTVLIFAAALTWLVPKNWGRKDNKVIAEHPKRCACGPFDGDGNSIPLRKVNHQIEQHGRRIWNLENPPRFEVGQKVKGGIITEVEVTQADGYFGPIGKYHRYYYVYKKRTSGTDVRRIHESKIKPK